MPPTSGFLLVLLLLGAVLLCVDLRSWNRASPSSDVSGWVFLQMLDERGRFLEVKAGERLGRLIRDQQSELEANVSLPCRQKVLLSGTVVRVVAGRNPEVLDCTFSPMPERYRYLLGLGLNVNRASEEELTLLPGIGRALAERIAISRKKRDSFLVPEDLLEVQGIGPNVLKKLEDQVVFSDG